MTTPNHPESPDSCDLDELERLAKAATPGPWTHGQPIPGHRRFIVANLYPWMVYPADNAPSHGTSVGDDVAFIAATNPSTVLALTTELRSARETIARLQSAEDCGQDTVCKVPPGCQRYWEERNRELLRENEVLRSNSDHLSSENASLARQVESMAMRIESLAEELAKPEDVRLREVVDALDGRAVIFDGLGARVTHLLGDMDEWIGRAGEAERLADERLAHANQLQADIEAEQQGRLALRKRLGARDDETMVAFLERLATMAGVVPADVHERGWQWRPTATDTAFAPPFGTIRQCRVCGCLVAGGPTACVRCAKAGE
jgi:hypothetical protein